MKKIKCSQCSQLVFEVDNCEECGKSFCVECLTYQGELAFCKDCEK